jgi:thiol-disulfide isomerase/thioredoxin
MKQQYVASIILVLLIALVAGCVACPQLKPRDNSGPMQGIDAALERGPVFIEFGATWCGWCTLQKPIVEELSSEYPGVSFIDVDVDENASLADAFYVNGVPQMNLIVKKNPDGSYLYVDIDGKTMNDRKNSAIIGYTEKDALKTALDGAMRARG